MSSRRPPVFRTANSVVVFQVFVFSPAALVFSSAALVFPSSQKISDRSLGNHLPVVPRPLIAKSLLLFLPPLSGHHRQTRAVESRPPSATEMKAPKYVP